MDYMRWIRPKIGHTKIFMAASGVVVYNDQGHILLQKRTDFDEWGIPGGALDLGESLSECAVREVLEETGLQVAINDLVGVYSEPKYDVLYPNGDETQQFTMIVTAHVVGGQLAPDLVETSELWWCPPEQLPFGQMRPWFDQMLHDATSNVLPILPQPQTTGTQVELWRKLRPLVGTAPIIAPGIIALVTRPEDDRILVIDRTDGLGWWPISGFADLGENAPHTVVREVREETGLIVEVERLLGVYSAEYLTHAFENGDVVKNVGVMYRAKVVGGEMCLDSAEARDYAWVTPAELIEVTAETLNGPIIQLGIKHWDSGAFIE
ncbi:MAG: NUDIX domain-containing protein [Candidatus Promineifilaceae bacterium]